jgi:hypothetical protein
MAKRSNELLSVEYAEPEPSPFQVSSKPVITKVAPSAALERAKLFMALSEKDESVPQSIEEGFDGKEEGCIELNLGLVPMEETLKKPAVSEK